MVGGLNTYQLVTRQTSLVLVHQRAEDEKAEGLPALEQVRHMMAAGHGGFGSVAGNGLGEFMCCLSQPSHAHVMRTLASYSSSELNNIGLPTIWRLPESAKGRKRDNEKLEVAPELDDIEIPHFLRGIKKSRPVKRTLQCVLDFSSPLSLLQAFDNKVKQNADAQNFVSGLVDRRLHPALNLLLKDLFNMSGDRVIAAALLLDWLQPRLAQRYTLSRQAERMLRFVLRGLSTLQLNTAWRKIEFFIPQVSADNWVA